MSMLLDLDDNKNIFIFLLYSIDLEVQTYKD